MANNKILKDLWFNTKINKATSFSSPNNLYLGAKKILPNIKKSEVIHFLHQQPEYSSFKEYRKSGVDRFTHVNSCGHLLAFDVMYMKNFKHKGGIKFLLVGVCVFSGLTKVAGLKSLKNTAVQFAKLLTEFEERFKVQNVTLDRGGEMVAVKKHAESKGINVYYAPEISVNKSNRCERAIRVIRSRMARIIRSSPTIHPLTAAKQAAESYNETVNSSTGVAPNNVVGEKIGEVIRKRMDNQLKKLTKHSFQPKYKVGDIVKLKIIRKNKVFVKSNQPSWGNDDYTILEVKHTQPRFSYIIKKVGGKIKSGSVPESFLLFVNHG